MVAPYLIKPRPTVHELRRKIRELKQLDLRHAEIESLKANLAPILHHYIQPSPLIQPGERIFRAVLWPIRPTRKHHLTAPPAHKVSYGRCNRPNEPIFYGSAGGIGAIRELEPSHGTRLVLSMWRVTKLMPTCSVGYSERAFAKLGSTRWSHVWWRQRNPSDPEPVGFGTPENKLVDRFLAREFTKRIKKGDDWQYKLSIAISETYLKAQPADNVSGLEIPGLIGPGDSFVGMETAGLVYPSIATDANDDNVALKCSIADSCLEFVWAQYIEIVKPTGKAEEFTPNGLDFANQLSSSGEIQWIGRFPTEFAAGTDLRLDTDGGSLVLKDSSNRIVGAFPDFNSSPA